MSYFNKAALDTIEMIIAVKIMHEEHRVLIYPGALPKVFSHIKSHLFPELIFVNGGIKQNEIQEQRTNCSVP